MALNDANLGPFLLRHLQNIDQRKMTKFERNPQRRFFKSFYQTERCLI